MNPCKSKKEVKNMIIDSHLHLTRKENFDEETLNKLKLKVPQNTQIEDLRI
jgi:hypothetical protein